MLTGKQPVVARYGIDRVRIWFWDGAPITFSVSEEEPDLLSARLETDPEHGYSLEILHRQKRFLKIESEHLREVTFFYYGSVPHPDESFANPRPRR